MNDLLPSPLLLSVIIKKYGEGRVRITKEDVEAFGAGDYTLHFDLGNTPDAPVVITLKPTPAEDDDE